MKPPPSDPYCKFCGSDTHYANRDCPAVDQRGPEWHRWYTPPDRASWHATKHDITGYRLCAGADVWEGGSPPPNVREQERPRQDIRKPIQPSRFEVPDMPVFRPGTLIPVGPAERPKHHPNTRKKT